MSAIVRVECTRNDGTKGMGTGFIVGNGNIAVTAFHVIEGAEAVKVIRYPDEIAVDSWTKGAYSVGVGKNAAEPVGTEGPLMTEVRDSGTEVLWRIDISILHLKGTFNNTSPLEFDTEFAKTGEDVLFAGYPGGGADFKGDSKDFNPLPLLSKAVVAFATEYGPVTAGEYCYWLDRPSFPANSGGPVLRLKTGKVAGVMSAAPFLPRKMHAKSGNLDVMVPDSYSVAFGTAMARKSVEDAIKS